MNKNQKSIPIEHEQKLYDALAKRGVAAKLLHNDGYKTVDIAVLPAHLYIEWMI